MRALLGFLAVTPAIAALMPMPANVVPGAGALKIDATFAVEARGYSDARLDRAMRRLVARVSGQTGIQIRGGKTVLWIECRAGGPQYPALGEDESYRMDVSAEDARISAATVSGALRGMETFAQWIDLGPDGFQAAAVHIDDSPRFPWRGLMLDVSRHWMPVDVVLRNLDAMAAVKLNVFHWHLSDDQGFRVESRRFPRLQGLGSDGHFYTQAEVRRVIEYARDRGIRVIPEFDMPGPHHQLVRRISGTRKRPRRLSDRTQVGSLSAHHGSFARADLRVPRSAHRRDGGLVSRSVFPHRRRRGGCHRVEPVDQNSGMGGAQWAKGPAAIQAYFNRRVAKIVASHGKVMIGWDEAFDGSLSRNTVIQSWRGQASLADVARAGFRGLLSFGYYLDHLQPASLHYAVDPLSGAARELSQQQKARILGGEACMWSEYVDAETIDSRVWPSAAAIAERLWSPSSVTDVDSMYQRLEAVSRMLDWAGLKHRVNYEPMLERLAGERPVRFAARFGGCFRGAGDRGTARCTALHESGGFEPFRGCGQAGE